MCFQKQSLEKNSVNVTKKSVQLIDYYTFKLRISMMYQETQITLLDSKYKPVIESTGIDYF